MTNKEAIKWLIRPTITTTGEAEGIQKKQLDAYHMAIEALLTNQCVKNKRGDLISRAELLEQIDEWRCSELVSLDINDARFLIQNAPSVSAERVGEWDDVLEIIINIESALFNLKDLCEARMASK